MREVKLKPCPRCGRTCVAWDGRTKPTKWVCGSCRHPLTVIHRAEEVSNG